MLQGSRRGGMAARRMGNHHALRVIAPTNPFSLDIPPNSK
jgi:hypothetical protein